MKKYLFLILLLLFSYVIIAQNSNETAKLKTEIMKLDLAHARAIFEGDAIALNTLMDDDVTVNHPTNQVLKEKKELVELINKGIIRYVAFERSPETFLFYDNMVIVMGREIVIPASGAPNANKKLHRRYTNIWMKRNGIWRLNARHANNICE